MNILIIGVLLMVPGKYVKIIGNGRYSDLCLDDPGPAFSSIGVPPTFPACFNRVASHMMPFIMQEEEKSW
jgi:hypothetical protein